MKPILPTVPMALVVIALLTPDEAFAQTPDFSICDGLRGAPWGLCRAGVIVGCNTGGGPPRICAAIEQTFETVTGSLPPWLEPPPPQVVCLCDYSVVPMTLPPWDDTSSELFQCPDFPDSDVPSTTRLVSLTDIGAKPESSLQVFLNYGPPLSFSRRA